MENSLSTHILALHADKKISKISRIRHVFDDIEVAKQAGVSHAALVALLEANGIDVTVKSLSKMLVKIRRDRGQASTGHGSLQRPKPSHLLPGKSTEGSPDAQDLSPKQRREKIAAQFIADSPVSPLLKTMKDKYI